MINIANYSNYQKMVLNFIINVINNLKTKKMKYFNNKHNLFIDL